MKISDIENRLTEYKNDNLLKDQTVEMVLASKKYFFAGIQKSNNQATILIKRKDYAPYLLSDFQALLSEFDHDTEVFLALEENSSNKSQVTNCFLGQCFLELEA